MSPFLPENWKIVYSVVSETSGKFCREKIKKNTKINRVKFIRKCLFVRLDKNFDQNTMSAFLRQNMQIVYLVVKEKYGKFFGKKK